MNKSKRAAKAEQVQELRRSNAASPHRNRKRYHRASSARQAHDLRDLDNHLLRVTDALLAGAR